MAVAASVLEAMLRAGCTAEQIVAVVKADEDANAEKLEKKREQNRIRQQKQRERNALSRVTDRDEALSPSPDKENTPTPPKETNPNPIKEKSPLGDQKKISPRHHLEAVLDADRAEAVIDHRQRIRKPLTARAAELLAAQFAKCDNPNAAADTMIERGWQGFKPEWLENDDRQRSQSPPRRETDLQRMRREMNEAMNGQGTQGEDFFSDGPAVQGLSRIIEH